MKEAAIAVVYNEAKDQILLIKRRDVSVWVLPGGGIEQGESPDEAVKREVWEETGLRVEIVRQIAEYIPINRLSKKTFLFACKKIDGTIRTSCETSAIAYFPIQKLPQDLFVVHLDWLQDTFLNDTKLIKKTIDRVTWWGVFKYFTRHPFQVIRFLFTALHS